MLPVIVSGFMTSKGELVRSIMFPKPVDFKFSQDTYKFIAALALIACIGMIYTLVLMVSAQSTMVNSRQDLTNCIDIRYSNNPNTFQRGLTPPTLPPTPLFKNKRNWRLGACITIAVNGKLILQDSSCKKLIQMYLSNFVWFPNEPLTYPTMSNLWCWIIG